MAKAPKTTLEMPEVQTKKGPIEVHASPTAHDGIKSLLIELQGHKEPKYVFVGDWTGKDIHAVLRTLKRAYLMRNVELRRALAKPVAQLTEVTTNA